MKGTIVFKKMEYDCDISEDYWISKNACQTDTIVKDGHYVYKVVSFLFVYNLISDKDGYYISQLISRRLI